MRTTSAFVRLIQASAVASLLLVGAGCAAPAPQGGQAVPPAPAPSSDAPAPRPGGPTGAMIVRPGGNSIYVAAQRPGKSVTVTLLSLKAAGFVVIREKDAMAGQELGKSALLRAGDNNAVVIDLSRASKDGETLYAAIYADDGDGVFGLADAAVLSAPNEPLTSSFEISATAPEHPVINF
ncbi:MAG TPA: hypothetical protein VLC10_02755 [Patescibacteria group bacterium]|nr:hypothetical protein [Patescibacteria group bacterium]